ncbi:hypothetical protein ABZP36_024337 [Zizania latifolia]
MGIHENNQRTLKTMNGCINIRYFRSNNLLILIPISQQLKTLEFQFQISNIIKVYHWGKPYALRIIRGEYTKSELRVNWTSNQRTLKTIYALSTVNFQMV